MFQSHKYSLYQGRSNTADYCGITVQSGFSSSPELLTEVQESTMDVAGTSDTTDTVVTMVMMLNCSERLNGETTRNPQHNQDPAEL